MPKISGELQSACIEHLASDPASSVSGRIWLNTAAAQIKTDDGTNKRALLRNDAKAIIGNNGTANNNVRFHRGANEVLQLVQGGDATAEGSLSTAIAQISAKQEGYAAASKPAAGNKGRLVMETDTNLIKVDDGAAFQELLQNPMTTKGDLITYSTANARLGVGADGQVLTADSAQSTGLKWAAAGSTETVTTGPTLPYTVLAADQVIILTGATGTVTLPAATGSGRKLKFIHGGTSLTQVYTIDGDASDTIRGATTFLMHTNGQTVEIIDSASNAWSVLSHYASTDWVSAGTISVDGTTSAPTLPTTSTIDQVYWRRSGKNVFLHYEFDGTTGGAAGSGKILFDTPTNISFDTTALRVNTELTYPGGGVVGTWHMRAATSHGYGSAAIHSATEISLYGGNSAGNGWVDSGFFPFSGNPIIFSIHVSGPITNWEE